MIRRTLRALPRLLAAILVGSCTDTTAPPPPAEQPVPGTLSVTLHGSVGGDGALILRMHGPSPLTALTAARADYVVHARGAADSVRAALFGPIEDGVLVTVSVPDVRRVAEYQASIVEVSDTTNALRPSVSSYVLTVTK